MSPQKNVFLLLVLSAFATLATAGETITFDGSDPTLLQTSPWGSSNSLFPTSPTGNTVNVTGGTVGGYVFGGWSISGNATGNSVSVSGGLMGENVFGGFSDIGNATHNTVTLSSTARLAATSNLFGGGGFFTGNTLNLVGWQGKVANCVVVNKFRTP